MTKEPLTAFFKATGLVPLQVAEDIAGNFRESVVDKNDFFLKAGRISDEYFFWPMAACVHLPTTLTVTK